MVSPEESKLKAVLSGLNKTLHLVSFGKRLPNEVNLLLSTALSRWSKTPCFEERKQNGHSRQCAVQPSIHYSLLNVSGLPIEIDFPPQQSSHPYRTCKGFRINSQCVFATPMGPVIRMFSEAKIISVMKLAVDEESSRFVATSIEELMLEAREAHYILPLCSEQLTRNPVVSVCFISVSLWTRWTFFRSSQPSHSSIIPSPPS